MPATSLFMTIWCVT